MIVAVCVLAAVLLLAHIMLPIRCLSLGLLMRYFPNRWALTATQALEGIGAGIYDTMIPLVVVRLARKTGHYGFLFGFIITCWRLGHGVSVLVAEGIYELSSCACAVHSPPHTFDCTSALCTHYAHIMHTLCRLSMLPRAAARRSAPTCILLSTLCHAVELADRVIN